MGNGLDRLRSTVAHFGVKKPDLTGLENTKHWHMVFVIMVSTIISISISPYEQQLVGGVAL
jgi:hypothetical protein